MVVNLARHPFPELEIKRTIEHHPHETSGLASQTKRNSPLDYLIFSTGCHNNLPLFISSSVKKLASKYLLTLAIIISSKYFYQELL
jgi:hypothetical protein